VNSSLLSSGLSAPTGIAVSGSNIYVTNAGNNTIGEYTTDGLTVNASLISGLSAPTDIVVQNVPEPSTWVLLAAGVFILQQRKKAQT